MELLSGEVPTGPDTPTNSNSVQVQQRQIRKRICIDYLFFLYIFISIFGWARILSNLTSRFPQFNQYVSPNCPDPQKIGNEHLKNIYEQNFSFDLHVFISENETNFNHDGELIWKKSKLVYGDLQSASVGLNTNVSISEVSQVRQVVAFFDRWILFGIEN